MLKRNVMLSCLVFLLSNPAFAWDERMDEYMECWSKVATADIPDISGEAYVDALGQAVARANKFCNRLARHAAKTNGKHAVNDVWRYMEVQFYNANLREK